MKSKNKFIIIFIMLYSNFFVLNLQSQLTNTVYLCIVDSDGMNLIETRATQPVGFMFSRTVGVYVFSDSSNPIVGDIIRVTSDTVSGTYRRTGDVLRGAYTTNGLPQQGNLEQAIPQTDTPDIRTCQARYTSKLEGLDRTILLPVAADHAMVVHKVGAILDYDNPTSTLIIGAVGLYFRDATPTNYPHFQLLHFSGGIDDVVSIALPDLVDDTEIYIVARNRLSQNMIDPDGYEDHPLQFMRPIDGFIARLIRRDEDFLNTVMSNGQFRMYAQYGTEVIYEPNSLINIERLSTFVPREFAVGGTIHMIDCNLNIPYVRQNRFTHFLYLNETSLDNESVGRLRDKSFVIEEVRNDGILLIQADNGTFAVPTWLVETGEPLDCSSG